MKNISIVAIIFLLSISCTAIHKKIYYSKVDLDNKSRYQDGHHLHEAQRLIDYKNKNRARIEKKSDKKQDKIAEHLNDINKNTQVKLKKKKKIKFDFYM